MMRSDNPEFQRQIWLTWSLTRALVMPALLGLAAAAVALAARDAQEAAANLARAAVIGFVVVVWLYGSREAGASMVDEIRDRTWDQQRMGALLPWPMTWGKLLGSTSLAWWGGAICAGVYAAAAVQAGLAHWPLTLLTLVAGGVALQALASLLNLHMALFDERLAARGGLWWLLVLALWSFGPISLFSSSAERSWWGLMVNGAALTAASAVLIAGCLVVALWRRTADALAVRQLPWAWPLLSVVLAAWGAGFGADAADSGKPALLFTTVVVIAAALTYVVLVSEPNHRTRWAGVLARMAQRDWRKALQQLPLWPASLALVLVAAVLALLAGDATPASPNNLLRAAQSDRVIPLTVALLLVRDCALACALCWRAGVRRPVGAFLLCLLVLYVLLPWLAGAVELKPLVLALLPPVMVVTQGSAIAALAVAAAHAAVGLGLAVWSWRRP
ncbi:hypothetical protein [Piscinibacterium candidicorallinum]|uniref:ABC-2 type transport system permease protein n=1 Tax=Piscinibacterium candidicorallinum TaxID=1793872 RepID=A0ABV7H3V2_9BURK